MNKNKLNFLIYVGLAIFDGYLILESQQTRVLTNLIISISIRNKIKKSVINVFFYQNPSNF